MKPRITINLTSNGELEIWVNDEGRNLLIRELQALSEKSEHFHLGAWPGAEVELEARAYRSTDKLVTSGKVLFRTDEWDRANYPHVLEGDR